jgi:hypothetical protein
MGATLSNNQTKKNDQTKKKLDHVHERGKVLTPQANGPAAKRGRSNSVRVTTPGADQHTGKSLRCKTQMT